MIRDYVYGWLVPSSGRAGSLMLFINQLDSSMRFKNHSCNGSCTKDVEHLSGSGSNVIDLITGRQLKKTWEKSPWNNQTFSSSQYETFTSSYLIVPETKVNKGMEKAEQKEYITI